MTKNFNFSSVPLKEGEEMIEDASSIYDDFDDLHPVKSSGTFDLVDSLSYPYQNTPGKNHANLAELAENDVSHPKIREQQNKYAQEEREWCDMEQSTEQEHMDYIDRLATDDDLSPFSLAMPEQMPEVVKLSNRILPDKLKPINTLVLLPIHGTLATGERHHPLSGGDQLNSLSFYICVCGNFATGKSFMAQTKAPLLEDLEKEDEKKYEHENLNRRRAARNLSTDDFICDSRIMTASVSRKAILQQIAANKGKHVLITGAEIDTLADSKYSDWANTRDIIKNGFDNESAGSNYASQDSVYGNVPVYLNMLVSGTYDHVFNFCANRKGYPDDAIISRFCFAVMKEEPFAPRPKFKSYDSYDRDCLQLIAQRLTAINGIYDCNFVSDALNRWEERRLEWAKAHNNRAVDLLLHRVTEIGHRAGQLFACCEDIHDKNIDNLKYEKSKQELLQKQQIVANAAVYVAELVLRNQYYLFGEHLQKQCEATSAPKINAVKKKAYYDEVRAMLPVKFNKQQFIDAYRKFMPTWNGEYKQIQGILSKWCNSTYAFCRKINADTWEKIVPEEIKASPNEEDANMVI